MGEVVYGSGYYKTILGILKLVEILLLIIALILVSVGYGGWGSNLIDAFYAGTIIGIILSLLIFIFSSTDAGQSMNGVLKFQCYLHFILFLYILIVSAILTARSSRTVLAGAVFGLISSLVYLIDAVISYQSYGNKIFCS